MKIIFITFFILSLSILVCSRNRLKEKLKLHEDVLCHTPYPVYFISRSTGYYLGRSIKNYKSLGPKVRNFYFSNKNPSKIKVLLNYLYDKWALCSYNDPGSVFNLEENKFLSWRFDVSMNKDVFFLADPNANLNQNWGFDYEIDKGFYIIWNYACNNCYLTVEPISYALSLQPLVQNNPNQQWTLFVQKK